MTPDELRHLLEAHARLLHGVALAYCRNPSDRDDVLQDIALQLWRARARYDGHTRPTTWMYRIAINAAISFYRRERRHAATAPWPDDHDADVPAVEPAAPLAALGPVLRRLAALPPLDRALVVMWLEDHDHAAIAEVLGLSISNVGTRLARIKQRLRDEVATVLGGRLPAVNDLPGFPSRRTPSRRRCG